jgi:hypothetical protein
MLHKTQTEINKVILQFKKLSFYEKYIQGALLPEKRQTEIQRNDSALLPDNR